VRADCHSNLHVQFEPFYYIFQTKRHLAALQYIMPLYYVP